MYGKLFRKIIKGSFSFFPVTQKSTLENHRHRFVVSLLYYCTYASSVNSVIVSSVLVAGEICDHEH
jgi:hypothetical protein